MPPPGHLAVREGCRTCSLRRRDAANASAPPGTSIRLRADTLPGAGSSPVPETAAYRQRSLPAVGLLPFGPEPRRGIVCTFGRFRRVRGRYALLTLINRY